MSIRGSPVAQAGDSRSDTENSRLHVDVLRVNLRPLRVLPFRLELISEAHHADPPVLVDPSTQEPSTLALHAHASL